MGVQEQCEREKVRYVSLLNAGVALFFSLRAFLGQPNAPEGLRFSCLFFILVSVPMQFCTEEIRGVEKVRLAGYFAVDD